MSKPPAFKLRPPPPVREHPFHESVARVLTLEIARAGHVSRDGVVWWTVDAGVAEGALPGTALARGMISGVPDILIISAGQAFLIELKAADGEVRASQRSVLCAVLAAGGRVGVAASIEQVLACLDGWAIPRARRVRLAA